MAKLTFPTLAEQCLAEFREAKKTTSITKTAKKYDAFRDDEWPSTRVYVFPDGTTIRSTGAGRTHKAEALLP